MELDDISYNLFAFQVELPRFDDEKVEDIKLGAELQYEMTHTNICSLMEVYQVM